jgi:hypothetical protein
MDQKSDASLEKRRYSGSREEVSQGHFVEGRGPSCRSPARGHLSNVEKVLGVEIDQDGAIRATGKKPR